MVMMPVPAAQIPARLDTGEPILILAIDAAESRVLFIDKHGTLRQADFWQVTTAWHYDAELEVWVTDVATFEDLVEEADAEPLLGDDSPDAGVADPAEGDRS
jgi:hypothetical protein